MANMQVGHDFHATKISILTWSCFETKLQVGHDLISRFRGSQIVGQVWYRHILGQTCQLGMIFFLVKFEI